MGRFTASRNRVAGEQTFRFKRPAATGAGFDAAPTCDVKIRKVNGEIITTILIDIQGLAVGGDIKDIIGESGAAAAYITKAEYANNGGIYKIEMGCIETPAGTNTTADIDLVSNTDSLAEGVAHDSAGTRQSLILPGGDWEAGTYKVNREFRTIANLNNDFLYLANGSGANSGGTYTAGKFIIKLFGANF